MIIIKKKKLFLLTISFFCCLIFSTSVSADCIDTEVLVSLQINNPIMKINGVETEIDAGRGTVPVIINGRTLVPIRAIIEAFGGTAYWDESTRSVHLTMENDFIILQIDNTVAYLNSSPYILDTVPTIQNGRTLLPIRFVAEKFNLGVAWDDTSQTIFIIRDTFDISEYTALMSLVPAYNGEPYIEINNNIPFFDEYEVISSAFEYYSTLDSMGRCNVCISSVDNSLRPTEERGSISSVKPTGWINKSYDSIPGGYLYNRCHLIGYQLTGENVNIKNLITGTRYLNMEGMLPFENKIADYLDVSQNHVMYRVTPVFSGENHLVDGVLLEAYSVEDKGAGICFCVFCYNVQPGVILDYKTGLSFAHSLSTKEDSIIINDNIIENDMPLYSTSTGTKYHKDPDCGGKNSHLVSLDIILEKKLSSCKKCFP